MTRTKHTAARAPRWCVACTTVLVVSIAAVTFAACEAPPQADSRTVRPWLERFGLDPIPATTRLAHLSWQSASSACPHVYRIEVHYDHAPMNEPDVHEDLLALASPDAYQANWRPSLSISRLAVERSDSVRTGKLHYRGFRVARTGTDREYAISKRLLGPASPTAACQERTWDPTEDALALGWPELPDRVVMVDEVWQGMRVEGRCNRSACIDPDQRRGGPDNHHRTCTTMSWRERLLGVYELGGVRFAAIASFWSDGHDTGKGIWSERTTLVSLDHGRMAYSTTTVHHGFFDMTRTYTIYAIDDCPGGFADVGWAIPSELAELARVGAEAVTG